MLKDILKKIKEYKVVTLFRHIQPDGDAFGSQAGLAEIIKKNFPSIQVYMLGADPSGVLASIFPKMDQVEDEKIKDSLAIILDTGVLSRVDDNRFNLAKEIIKIDHHIFVEKWGVIDYVDEKAASCAEIIVEFASVNNLALTDLAARYLFTGISTDTGRFMYQNVKKKTFELISLLFDYNVDHTSIFSRLGVQKENEVKFKGYILYNYKKSDNGLAYIHIPKEIKELYNIEIPTRFVNTLASIEGINVWMISAEIEGGVQYEFRSNTISVDSLARCYGGGGHRFASGATVKGDNPTEKIIDDINNRLYIYKNFDPELSAGLNCVYEAGKEILTFYNNKFETSIKSDDSPVTDADLASDKIICNYLQKEYPEDAILSEERVDDDHRLQTSRVWIVDPIDGTSDFINKTDEFAINVALAIDGKLFLSLVYAPAKNKMYFCQKDRGSYLISEGKINKIQVSNNQIGELKLVLSKMHLKEEDKKVYQNNPSFKEVVQVGSSYKLALIAEGIHDCAFKIGKGTKEWDTAAPALLIEEAGGTFVDFTFMKQFTYNKENVHNLEGYIGINNKQNLIVFTK